MGSKKKITLLITALLAAFRHSIAAFFESSLRYQQVDNTFVSGASQSNREEDKVVCTGQRKNTDSIVILGQKNHSTYDKSHGTSLRPVLHSLEKFYTPHYREADILILHEGDLAMSDIQPHVHDANVRFCDLRKTPAWGPPKGLMSFVPSDPRWSAGYRFMIRLHGVTIWDLMASLGYEYIMRLDDDSEILSSINYNIFTKMRKFGLKYGFRSYSLECGDGENQAYDHFMGNWIWRNAPKQIPRLGNRTFCGGLGKTGFYNNFYVTQVGWWRQRKVVTFLKSFDETNLALTRRVGDMAVQTTAVRLFMSKRRVIQFLDWTYRHHTIKSGKVEYGGMETGYLDPNAAFLADRYRAQYFGIERIVSCPYVDQPGCSFPKSIEPSTCINLQVSHVMLWGAPLCLETVYPPDLWYREPMSVSDEYKQRKERKEQ